MVISTHHNMIHDPTLAPICPVHGTKTAFCISGNGTRVVCLDHIMGPVCEDKRSARDAFEAMMERRMAA